MDDIIPTLVWLTATFLIWLISRRLTEKLRISSLRNPLFFAIIVLCILLPGVGLAPSDYLAYVRPLTFLIGLATVALALPLWQQRMLIHANARAMLLSTLVSTVTGILAAVALGWLFGLDQPDIASMGPKMTTLAVALPLSRLTGGWDNLAILCVMCNGVGGSFISSALWKNVVPESGPEERAFSLGLSSHAMGIARTLAVSPDHVSLASCGMLLSALMTAILYGLALATAISS
ncbi:putative effector of murein hydrolase [Pararhizobium capsulatum DSM 1112]|uniref:Effector of murein hydrolase n=1 Tax=Pararhizobium capsulatum DSM 1112 TaxID=1121113 RepID=A0ABU0BYI0_9HYPH|nr:LrgB family protein [Pararhizobium capsulatum]MDQ0323325.1 putative effector of murein hydrolase [Pararhizobium capsulatum DSM 1112]